MTTIYNSGTEYGSGNFYGGAASSSTGIPQSLRFYRTSSADTYVFYWTFQSSFITPSLSSADFQLELDTTPAFDSPNLVSFTSATVISFQNGNVWKGFAVPVASRVNLTTQVWYARVRTISGSFTSDWSDTLTWTIPQSWQQYVAESLMDSLPDAHVYGKGDLLLPVDQRNSNLYLVENMYGNQLDLAYYENFLTQTDNFISLVRDEFLYPNFGVLFNFPKSNLQTFIEYRETLRQLILGSLNGGSLSPIFNIIQSFTGVPPVIQNIRDLNDFYLNYIQETPLNWLNILSNGGFESWSNGIVFNNTNNGAQTADNWINTFLGSPVVNISRESAVVHDGTYSMKIAITSTGGAGSSVGINEILSNYNLYAGKTITFSIWINTTLTDVRPFITDGSIIYGTTHPGDGAWHQLTVTKVISNSPLYLAFGFDTGSAIAVGNIYADSALATIDIGTNVGTDFYVSYEFVAGSMQVFKNGTRLIPGVDFTEDAALPGFITTSPLISSDTLVAAYKIGLPADPTPVLFSPPQNLVLNGNFSSWSLGNSFTNPVNTQFVADNWKLGVIGVPVSTVSKETTNVDTGTSTAIEIDIIDNTGNTLWDMYQIIPSFESLRGHTVQVSARIQASTSGTYFYLYDGFSNPGVSITTSSGYTTYTLTMTVAQNATTFQVGFGTPSGQIPNGIWYIDNVVLIDQIDSRFISGFTTFTNGSEVVSGINTSFTTDITANDIIADGAGYYATVGNVNSNTSLTLLNPWGGPTETVPGLKATYNIPPLVLWDKATLAFGVVISIPNPGNFNIDLSLIESLVNPLLPASAKVYYQLVS